MNTLTKARNLYLLMARQVATEDGGGMVSIHDIIDKFNSVVDKASVYEQGLKPGEATVALNVTYFVATSWLFDKKLSSDTFLNIALDITDPAGKRLGGPEQEHLIPKGSGKLNLNFHHQGLPVTKSGSYLLHAKLLTKDHKLIAEAEYPFEVQLEWQ